MSPMALVIDELHRAGDAGELVITPRSSFPVAELATMALVPLLALPWPWSDHRVADGKVVVSAHPPTQAQLRQQAGFGEVPPPVLDWDTLVAAARERSRGLSPGARASHLANFESPSHRWLRLQDRGVA